MAGKVVNFSIKGLDELQHQLEEAGRQVGVGVMRKGLQSGAKVIEDEMVNLAPKDTGFLASHFGTRTKIIKEDIAGIIYIGPEGKMDYPKRGLFTFNRKGKQEANGGKGRISVASVARFFEFGTSKMAAKPFMTQAFEAKKDEAVNKLISVIKDVLAKLTRR